MKFTRREFLQDLAFAAAIAGLPDWAANLDESSMDAMLSMTSSGFRNPWSWVPAADLGVSNPYVTVLNRIQFGARPGDFDRIQQIGIDNYIDEQLAPEKIDDSSLDKRLADLFPSLSLSIGDLMSTYPQPRQIPPEVRAFQQFRKAELGLRDERQQGPAEVISDLQDATMMRAIFSRRQLFEVVTDFWTNHFNIDIRKNDARWMKSVDDREVIRKYALGKFRDLLLASAQSPAMIEYLDNRTNVKGVANENYAREIMELHTLGVDGGYTQKDVQELARCFTGWTIVPPRAALFGLFDYSQAGTFVFNLRQHDDTAKKVIGLSLPKGGGINDAIKVIDALAAHPSTAKYLSTKLIRRFVADDPPDALVQRTAQTYLSTGGDIRAVLGSILHSDEFKNSFAQKIKRPFEYIASSARALDMQLDDVRPFSLTLQLMGQGSFMHLTPDGYPDSGAAWINTNNLLARWNLSLMIASNRVPRGKVDYKSLFNASSVKTVGEAVDYATNLILHRAIPTNDRQKLVDAISQSGPSATFDANRTPDLVALILASPHFQYR